MKKHFCFSSGKEEDIYPVDPVNPVKRNSLRSWRLCEIFLFRVFGAPG
jgi:hypothetical protein